MSNHLFQVKFASLANDTGTNSCDDQSQSLSTSNCSLPGWWKRIKAVQVLENEQK